MWCYTFPFLLFTLYPQHNNNTILNECNKMTARIRKTNNSVIKEIPRKPISITIHVCDKRLFKYLLEDCTLVLYISIFTYVLFCFDFCKNVKVGRYSERSTRALNTYFLVIKHMSPLCIQQFIGI